jgi:hypothetical protein
MSEIEEAATTVSRLIRRNLRVIKDDNSLATINVSGEWQNADALKGCDGQITVGLRESVDKKLDLSGEIRRRTTFLRVNVWSTDTSHANDGGRTIQLKILQEIHRITDTFGSKPNETQYDLTNLGTNQPCKAYQGVSEDAPDSSSWGELSDVEQQKLWYSDDNRHQVSRGGNGEYAALLFGFRVESRRNTAKKIALLFEGYGSAPGGSGVTVKVWSNSQAAWVSAQTGGAGAQDQAIVITLTAGASDFISSDGYVWLLARTSSPSNGSSPATLFCDYASCTITVNGITYCEVTGCRSLDRVDVKPFIYRTELSVKSWFFLNKGV